MIGRQVDDFVQVDYRFEVDSGGPCKHLDPDRGVNEDHGRSRVQARVGCAVGRCASRPSPPPKGPNRPVAKCDLPLPFERIPSSLVSLLSNKYAHR